MRPGSAATCLRLAAEAGRGGDRTPYPTEPKE